MMELWVLHCAGQLRCHILVVTIVSSGTSSHIICTINGDMKWYGMLKHKPLTGQEHGKHYCQHALVKVCISAACKHFAISALGQLNPSITHPRSKCNREMYLLFAVSIFAGVENG